MDKWWHLAMIYASFFAVLALHIALFRRRGFIDPISVFFLAFLYYSYFAPIAMLSVGEDGLDFAGSLTFVSQKTINQAAILFFVGYLGFSLGYMLVSRGKDFTHFPIENRSLRSLLSDPFSRVVLFGVIAILAIIISFFGESLQQSTESYEGKIYGNYTGSSYAFFINSALTMLSLLINFFILKSRRFLLIFAFSLPIFVGLTVLTYSKAPLIYAALTAFCVLHRIEKVPFSLKFGALLVGAVAASILFMPAFSIFRGTGEFVLRWPQRDSISLVIGEAASPFTIVHLAFNGYVNAENHPILQSFVLWIPRAIWAARPTDIAEDFAQQVIVGWQAGLGLGFSLFAESYVRMGLVGAPIFLAMAGMVFAAIQNVFSLALPATMRAPAMLTVGGIVSVLVLRGAFSGLLTQSLQNWIPVFIISVFASEVARRMQPAPPSNDSDSEQPYKDTARQNAKHS